MLIGMDITNITLNHTSLAYTNTTIPYDYDLRNLSISTQDGRSVEPRTESLYGGKVGAAFLISPAKFGTFRLLVNLSSPVYAPCHSVRMFCPNKFLAVL